MKPIGKNVDPKDRAFGRHVQKLRKDRGLTQRELASALGRTSSWMSQVERGVQPMERLDMLQDLADALGVSVRQLRSDVPTPDETDRLAAEDLRANDMEEARRMISGHPAIGALLGAVRPTPSKSLAELEVDVEQMWALTHQDRFADVNEQLMSLLPDLEQTARVARDTEQRAAYLLLARMYQALAAAFGKQGEADAAWVAADRAIWAAEQSGDTLLVCAGVFRMVHAFVRLKRLEQAEHAAQTAIDALHRADSKESLTAAGLSVLGSLHLAIALVHARGRQRTGARVEIENARAIAQRMGEDRNDYNLEFGRTNVEIQAVSAAVDLGDAGEALEIGRSIDATGLSLERQGRLLMDMGRAYAQLRDLKEAEQCLLRAEALVPETVQGNVTARGVIQELVLVSGKDASPELLGLAERADVK